MNEEKDCEETILVEWKALLINRAKLEDKIKQMAKDRKPMRIVKDWGCAKSLVYNYLSGNKPMTNEVIEKFLKYFCAGYHGTQIKKETKTTYEVWNICP